MKAITFKNTAIKVSSWPGDLHLTHGQGYAYEMPTHYVFLCGGNSPYIGISFIEQKSAAGLEDWCRSKFGATIFQPVEYDVGAVIDSVWRPGIHSPKELGAALAFTDEGLSRASQALRLLVSRLDEILLFVEPDAKYLQAYGHKSRDLLIAACTEVENYFQHYMQHANAIPLQGKYFTVKDYVRLQPRLFLDEFEISMYAYPMVGVFAPFLHWNSANFVLPWYDAYNKTKHHRDSEFARATLINCIHAVGACLVLFSIRFGPTWWQANFVNSPVPDAYRLFRQPPYKGDPRKVYVPKIEWPKGVSGWSAGDHTHTMVPWQAVPFTL